MNDVPATVLHGALGATVSGLSHPDDVRAALGAVVQMHRPFGEPPVCAHCIHQPYPCRTIREIVSVLRLRIYAGDKP